MYKQHHIGNQHGGTTLAITVILLFVMTLVTLYAAKTSITEQQISANQYRADQSLSTANAALDWGVANYTKISGKFCDKRLLEDEFAGAGYTCPAEVMCTIYTDDTDKCKFAYTKSDPLEIGPGRTEDALSIGASEMYYAYVYEDGNEYGYIKVTGGPGETYTYDTKVRIYEAKVKVVGVGHSDDKTGMRTVSQDVDSFNVFGDPGLGGNSFPLITKATADGGANFTIINRFDNRTIWSGDVVKATGSLNTYVAKPPGPNSPNCHDLTNRQKCIKILPDLETDMEASKGIDVVNSDVIDEDTNLHNLDPVKFFENFFGRTKDEVRWLAEEMGHLITSDDKGNLSDKDSNSVKWSNLADKTPLVWIDATNIEGAAGYAPTGADMAQLGMDADPMVLIIDGDITVGASGTELVLVGLLYVTGNFYASGNPAIRGMVIVETKSSPTGGTPTLIYDSDLFSGKLGPKPGTVVATVPSTWKDWE